MKTDLDTAVTASTRRRRRQRWRLLLGLCVVVGLGALLPQLGTLGRSVEELRNVSLWWIPLVVAVSALSFLGSALSLQGASPVPLPLGRTVAANVAASFTGRLAPGSLGSMGTVGVFLHKQGVSPAQAGTAVAVDAAAGVVVHVLLLAVATGVLGGGSGLPSLGELGWAVTAGLALIALLSLLGRRLARSARPALARASVVVREAGPALLLCVRSPRRGLQLIGGSMLVTASQVATLALALVACGGRTPVWSVAVAYLAAAALAAAAPTPGGLGAMEAGLVAALGLLGTATGPALAGVLFYRLVTFWLPLLPGAVVLQLLRRRHAL